MDAEFNDLFLRVLIAEAEAREEESPLPIGESIPPKEGASELD